ncbi:hypothetical protein K8Z61_07745 [Nocardioides sp. TRM66260-LWL]|uniref:hypothetical protein n=1 Tax=Nocardioides sp. TRM66260-LWL TaxID=2874478 RepID=UPI001CC55FD6|nr:hypothetical protein [Nocardioides sp. TRM66260-LWL]MBZ5734387.1 hypothetical protein [Nocardioides sp. TRM66260-LWL]
MSRRSLRDWLAGRDKRPLAVSVTALLLAAAIPSLAPASADQPRAAAETSKPAFSETRTIDRTFVNADGSVTPVLTKDVTVTADQTENLRGRQRILISWKGAQPSGGRATNPYGDTGMAQEYPVMILQCRGTDDPKAPATQRLSPSTCFTASVAERSQIARGAAESTWLADRYNTAADRQRLSGVDPFPNPATCPGADVPDSATHLTPFVAVGSNAKTYASCNADQMPPEAAVGAAFPPAEIAAFTDLDGTGQVQFEVRSDVENESLGCNDKVRCSVVVIPILGLSCDKPSVPSTTLDRSCRKGGRFPAGSSNFAGQGVDQAVSPALWWSESNWRNRFTIPITFGLPPNTCDLLDPRPPTGFYGSELLAQAGLQWAPAYCLRKDRFKFQLNQTSDVAGWNLMLKNEAAAAEVSSARDSVGAKVGYAPTAVTGFAVGYAIDKPDNAGEFTNLRLNARLLAKLYTQSYVGSALGQGHPGLAKNPLGLMNDPEFQRLNPGLSTISQEAGATVLSLSNDSDVLQQLTSYIAEDPDARAFIAGKPDPWGMVVNPSYKDVSIPTEGWPLLDTYIPKTEDPCRQANPGIYFNQLAAPVTTLAKIATVVLDAWPNVQTRCDKDQGTGLFKLGRIDRQNFGSRFVLGIVSLGDADRYGLRTAALQTKPGTFVAPSDASMAAALRLTRQKQENGPFVLDQADVRKSASAYPGTMVVYTAAKISGAVPADAKKVAQFIRVSTTEGQRPGNGNGQLPGGFLPIVDSGATRPLFRSAQRVAQLVAEQKADPTTDGGGSDGTGGTDSSGGLPPGGGTAGGGTLPTGGGAGAAPGGVAAPAGGASGGPSTGASTAPGGGTAPVAMPATQAVGSRTAGGLLPSLLILGLIGIAVASGVRFFVQPTRPASPGAAGR